MFLPVKTRGYDKPNGLKMDVCLKTHPQAVEKVLGSLFCTRYIDFFALAEKPDLCILRPAPFIRDYASYYSGPMCNIDTVSLLKLRLQYFIKVGAAGFFAVKL